MSRWPRSTSHSREGSSSMTGLLPPTWSRCPPILASSSASKPASPSDPTFSGNRRLRGSFMPRAGLLRLHQAAVGAFHADHLVMGTSLDDAAALQHQDLVA